MAFFKRKHKKFAKCDYKTLQKGYHASEIGLQRAVASGDEKAMRKAMEAHQCFEYALLYRNTPEFRKKRKIVYTTKGRTIKQNNK